MRRLEILLITVVLYWSKYTPIIHSQLLEIAGIIPIFQRSLTTLCIIKNRLAPLVSKQRIFRSISKDYNFVCFAVI